MSNEGIKRFSNICYKLESLKRGKFAFRSNKDMIRKKGGRTRLNARGSTNNFMRLIDKE